MMYSYVKSTQTANGTCDTYLLEQAITHSTIATDIEYIKSYDDVIEIKFITTPPAGELSELNTLIGNHSADPLLFYKTLIQNAIEFFSTIQVEFSAENITMGITQLGKTKAVSDYLADVLRYGQSGSLYEVVNDINILVAAGVPAELSPFVTDARLNALRDKTLEYLGA